MARRKRRTKKEEMNSFTHHYRNVVVCRHATMDEVVQAAVKQGWPLPVPQDVFKILVRRFTDAQREETMLDPVTGEYYNANLCYVLPNGEIVWIDFDEAKFEKYVENAQSRRAKAVGIMTQAEKNNRHWNRTHEPKEQYELEFDLGPDVQWNLNQPKDKQDTGTDN